MKPHLVYKIAHLLTCAEGNNCVMEFLWVPVYVSIRGNAVADEVAGLAGGLSYQMQFGLSYVDLLDSIGGEYDTWAALVWPNAGVSSSSHSRWCSCGSPLFSFLPYGWMTWGATSDLSRNWWRQSFSSGGSLFQLSCCTLGSLT